jgi:hypothetical protein
MMSKTQPIIVTGMHRSGTSLVARTLGMLGLFMGWKLQGDEESEFIIELNDWVLSQLGARWDHAGMAVELQHDPVFRRLAVRYLRIRLRSLQARAFLGPRHLMRLGIEDIPCAWGWKDPRTTLTLPTWLELFPGLKVIHVARHGMDVAMSLNKRSLSLVESRDAGLAGVTSLQYLFRSRRRGITDSVRCLSLDEALCLWSEYEGRAAAARNGVPADHVLCLRYEDFLGQPREHLDRISAFCGLAPGPQQVRSALAQLRPDRSLAYRDDAVALAVAARHAQALRRHGYEP